MEHVDAGVALNGRCYFVFFLVPAPWAWTQIAPSTIQDTYVERAGSSDLTRDSTSLVHALSMKLAASEIQSRERAWACTRESLHFFRGTESRAITWLLSSQLLASDQMSISMKAILNLYTIFKFLILTEYCFAYYTVTPSFKVCF